jgi:hypothetical protein
VQTLLSLQAVPSAALLAWQAPEPLQVSGSVQIVSAALPHGNPLGWFGCVHEPVPLQMSFVHWMPSVVQAKPDGSLFAWHDPDPLQVLGLSQSVSDWLPQANPLGWLGCVHEPVPLQMSFVQSLPSVVQPVPDGSLFEAHAPNPSQLSGLSQSVSLGLPHVVPAAAAGCPQLPDPLHRSFVHGLPSEEQPSVGGSLFARQPPVALQVSGLSHSVSEALPHADPAGTNGCVQAPAPSHTSDVQSLPSEAHAVPEGLSLALHTPPKHVSGFVHAVVEPLPHAVPFG